MYYTIDETTARHAKEMSSFSDYVPGSATAEYRAAVDEAAALVEAKKAKLTPYYHAKLDGLLDTYARRLADWLNAYNRNAASCPSVMISGASNFPTRKKAKQNAREDTLWREYDSIKSLLDQIRALGTGPVDLADPDARQLLQNRLQALEAQSARGKAMNAHYRRHKTMRGFPGLTDAQAASMDADLVSDRSIWHIPYPAYALTSLRDKIKRTQSRLQELQALEAARQTPAAGTPFDLGAITGQLVRNSALNRLQILFDAKPGPDLRAQLKASGFRWSPSEGAWQRQLTQNALREASQILGMEFV